MNERWRETYDAWKLASPYDEERDPVDEEITIQITARTNKVGSEVKDELRFDLDDWSAMSEQDRETCLLEHLIGCGLIEWDWKELP